MTYHSENHLIICPETFSRCLHWIVVTLTPFDGMTDLNQRTFREMTITNCGTVDVKLLHLNILYNLLEVRKLNEILLWTAL